MFLIASLHLIFAVVVHAAPNVTFIALGDWGELALPGQKLVAEAMDIWSERNNPEFIMTTGDNFYPNGVSSVDDPGWDTKWRDIYIHNHTKDLPWYSDVGNHDYGTGDGEEWVQVEYSDIEPRWIMPHLWYSFHRTIGDIDLHMINLDTEALRREINNHTEMMEWFENELAESESEWKIVIGHRHMYSAGDVGPITSSVWLYIRPILEEYEADLYLCGHDHNLQHLQNIEDVDVDYVLSGGGGALLYPRVDDVEQELNEVYGVEVKFFDMIYGFVGFIITEDEMFMDFVDIYGDTVYTYTRYRQSG